jgi:ribosomal protein S18 acetylase RimI-like enzyme
MERRRLTSKDIPAVTEIHLKAFNDFFLSQLGEKFLTIYYKCFLDCPTGFGVGIFSDDNILLGFSVVTTQAKGFNKRLFVSNFYPFFKIGTKLAFTKPGALIRLMKNMTKRANVNFDDGEYAELFSIGVDPGKQGLGIGKMLLEDTEALAVEEGCTRITLTTDYCNNENVINFYTNMGYSVFYDFVAYPNRKMYKMIKKLN